MTQQKTAGYIFEEQRQATRENVTMEARGIVPNIDQAVDCTILDISVSGAKVELNGVDIVPRRFKLFVPETHTLWKCRVVRQTGKQVGLVFENKSDLSVE